MRMEKKMNRTATGLTMPVTPKNFHHPYPLHLPRERRPYGSSHQVQAGACISARSTPPRLLFLRALDLRALPSSPQKNLKLSGAISSYLDLNTLFGGESGIPRVTHDERFKIFRKKRPVCELLLHAT